MHTKTVEMSSILELLRANNDLALSFYMPTHRTIQARQQDETLVKTLVSRAKELLLQELSEQETQLYISKLESLIAAHDFSKSLDGFVCFVSDSLSQSFEVPFSVPELVVVGRGFEIRPLVAGLQRSLHYFVVELTQKVSKLYEAFNGSFHEIITPEKDALGNPVQGFPLDNVMLDSAARDIDMSEKDARYTDDRLKKYFDMIDHELGKMLQAHLGVPVVVCGVEKNLSLFKEITKHTSVIIGYQHGDFHSAFELSQAVKPLVETYYRQKTDALIQKFFESENQLQQAVGIHRVWLMAYDGRIDYLLVENNLVIPGKVATDNPARVVLHKAIDSSDVTDLINLLIERVLTTKGKVIFVEKGALKNPEGVGAILRY